MVLDKDEVLKSKIKWVTIKEFIDQYHPGLTIPAIDDAIKRDIIDYFRPGNERFIVLNNKTLNYQPSRSIARDSKHI